MFVRGRHRNRRSGGYEPRDLEIRTAQEFLLNDSYGLLYALVRWMLRNYHDQAVLKRQSATFAALHRLPHVLHW